MKKIILVIFLIFISFLQVNADSNFESDYTLIDCVSGDSDTGVPFDSTMPYSTLKVGIESTIKYINDNINKVGNEQAASGKTFTIKVQCSFDDILNQSINLNFDGVTYNNELIIEGIDEGSFIIRETDFKLGYKAGNMIFKNAKFLNENKPYFYDYLNTFVEKKIHPFSNGIKIIDSYIQLKNGNNIGADETYKLFSYYGGNRYSGSYPVYVNYQNYLKAQFIENSILDIEISKDFIFKMPNLIKNSKISFKNISGDGSFKINFSEDGNINRLTDYNYSVLISNEIDLGGNNLLIEDTNAISFLNNKFINFDNLVIDGKAVFINNYFENNSSINISNTRELYNNVFKSGFTDSYDITNNRKNFSENNIQASGFGWIYKRLRNINYFNIDINSADLYKEITGKVLPKGLGDIYVIFNY